MFGTIKNREHRSCPPRRLYDVTTGSLHFLQRLKLEKKLCVHDGCVNTIAWNDKGTLILSGSDDQHLAITDPFSAKTLVKFRSGHRSNIFSAKFLPGSLDREVVSCSGSGEIFFTDVDREDTYQANRFDCHFGTTYKLLVVPNEASTFLSCGDDGTVRFFDLRTKTSCSKFNCEDDVVIHLRTAITAIAADPIIPFQLAVAASDGIVRLYDRRMLKTTDAGGANESLICTMACPTTRREKRHYRITSLNYRPGSHDLLVNYSSENIYLFNTYQTGCQQTYSTQQPGPSGVTSKPVSQSRDLGGCASPGTSRASAEGAVGAVGGSPSDNGSDSENLFKPIKRLRLRGDWSDTGPDARPESEEPALTNTIMQRMSDLLTRMLNSRSDRGPREGGEGEEGEGEEETEESGQPGDSQTEARSENETEGPETSASADAAAVLRSVIFSSPSAAAARQSLGQERGAVARYTVPSEGLGLPDISSRDLDSGNSSELTAPSGTEATSYHTAVTSHVEVFKAPYRGGLSNTQSDRQGETVTGEHGVEEKDGEKEDGKKVVVSVAGMTGRDDSDAILASARLTVEQPDEFVCAENNSESGQVGQMVTPAQDVVSSVDEVMDKGRVDSGARGGSGSLCPADGKKVRNTDSGGKSTQGQDMAGSVVSETVADSIVSETVSCGQSLTDCGVNLSAFGGSHATSREDVHCVMRLTGNKSDISGAGHSGSSVHVSVSETLVENDGNSFDVDTDERRSRSSNIAPFDIGSGNSDSISEKQMSSGLCGMKPSSGRPAGCCDSGELTPARRDGDEQPAHAQRLVADDSAGGTSALAGVESARVSKNFTATADGEVVTTVKLPPVENSFVPGRGQERLADRRLEETRGDKPGTSSHKSAPTPSDSPSPSQSSNKAVDSLSGLSLSWSDSTVAVAEPMHSTYEGNAHPRSLDDVSNLPSRLSSGMALSTVHAEVSPSPPAPQQVSERQDSRPFDDVDDNISSLTVNVRISESSVEQSSSLSTDIPSQHSCVVASPDTGQAAVCDRSEITHFGATQWTDTESTHAKTTACSGSENAQTRTVNVAQSVPSSESQVCKVCGVELVPGVRSLSAPSLCAECAKLKQGVKEGLEKTERESLWGVGHGAVGAGQRNSLGRISEEDSDRSLEQEVLGGRKKDGKGKGVGKSSAKAAHQAGKTAAEFSPYNSGRMRFSAKEQGMFGSGCTTSSRQEEISSKDTDDSTRGPSRSLFSPSPPTDSKPMIDAHPDRKDLQDPTPGFRASTSGSDRHRRVGHSLPPTGDFQLDGNDEEDDDDNDGDDPQPELSNNKRKMSSDSDRMSRAAQKIQEVYRKKREAREMAKVMEVPQAKVLMKYSGHRNCRTMIKEANFYGDHFVMSGSDCGRILAWERETGRMVMYMDADRHVVNCIQPNQFYPVLASSGIDYDVKIWMPMEEDAQFDSDKAEMIVRRNELMLEETRDTVTVPAAFMLRVLASLSQIRTGRNSGRGQPSQDSASQE
ncbi:DDB1- and CUL4-associated factor 6 isoform X1 [Aplysia californica]|uniref:DDB1- and CUL4-associated factor 6 isoform X1 n=1 Tax=Aplysia californica TaxID=6500 RepID=A0ABM0JMY9_APLCA|nr:DDB1- and CUL4-associated factor 6 isoform X1 [Aplysia californica]